MRQPVQAGGDGQRAGVAVVAQPGADLFDAGADVRRVGEAVARQVDLVDVQRAAVDERAERLAAAFAFARRRSGPGERSRSQT